MIDDAIRLNFVNALESTLNSRPTNYTVSVPQQHKRPQCMVYPLFGALVVFIYILYINVLTIFIGPQVGYNSIDGSQWLSYTDSYHQLWLVQPPPK